MLCSLYEINYSLHIKGHTVKIIPLYNKIRTKNQVRYLIPIFGEETQDALSNLSKREGRAGAEGAILPYVGRLQLISTLKIGADSCQQCQYKVTKPNLIYPNPEE